MTGMPTPIAETNVVGRHGTVLERDIEYPRFDRDYTERGMAIVAINEYDDEPVQQVNGFRPVAERPVDPFVEIWR